MKNITKLNKETFGIKGKIIATICDVSTPKAKKMEAEIVRLKKEGEFKKVRKLISKFHRLFAVRKYVTNNLVPTVGRKSIARRLANDTTDTLIVNKGALGTDNTAAANGDTTLGTEVYRNDIASRAFSDNVAYLTFFYTAAECNGTYEEFGMFIDGAAGADTGVLFNHNVEQWTKSAAESMTIDVIVTIT